MPQMKQNPGLYASFYSAIRERRVAGCYLIEGAKGSGKLLCARHFAAALCCTSPSADGSFCGTCHSCRSIQKGIHVDVFELKPDEDGKQVTVENVREMLKNTYIFPAESDWRVFILEHCESLNEAAQNALLKSIEEPRPQTVFFLLTEDAAKLLPTVRSRAIRMKTEPMAPEEILALLEAESVPSSLAKEAALFSRGSLGAARLFASDPEHHKTRERVISYFSAIMEGANFSRLCTILPPASVTRKEFVLFLSMTKSALRDLLLAAENSAVSLDFFSDRNFVEDLSGIISKKRAVELFDLSDQALLANEGNANLFSLISNFHLNAKNLTRHIS